jgi:hypothetical protein
MKIGEDDLQNWLYWLSPAMSQVPDYPPTLGDFLLIFPIKRSSITNYKSYELLCTHTNVSLNGVKRTIYCQDIHRPRYAACSSHSCPTDIVSSVSHTFLTATVTSIFLS